MSRFPLTDHLLLPVADLSRPQSLLVRNGSAAERSRADVRRARLLRG